MYILAVKLEPLKSGMSKGALIGIVLHSIVGLVTISLASVVLFHKKKRKNKHAVLQKQPNKFLCICHDLLGYFNFLLYMLGRLIMFSLKTVRKIPIKTERVKGLKE